MARYIDAEELKKRAYPFPCAIGVEYAVSVRQINETPTADVVPKSEVDRLGEKYNELLEIKLANAKTEVAREIIDIIEQRISVNMKRLKSPQSGIWKIGYQAEIDAYKDIKEIIEQKYLMRKGGAE